MKYKFGKQSTGNLLTCTTNLQLVMNKALYLGLIDFSITEGIRSKAEQNRYYKLGRSDFPWPDSKHNVLNEETDRAKAVDAPPYVNSKVSYNYYHCCYLAGIILSTGKFLGIDIKWGGNWDMDGEPITDQDFQDLVHYEELL